MNGPLTHARSFCTLLLLLGSSPPLARAENARQPPNRAQVIVLCTLHQFHETSPSYSFAELSRIVERLKPDVLAVELTPTDLASRREQKVEQEYHRSIFPLLDAHGYVAVPLEPPEPLFSQLVQSMRWNEHFSPRYSRRRGTTPARESSRSSESTTAIG
jgi:hypothetical protein